MPELVSGPLGTLVGAVIGLVIYGVLIRVSVIATNTSNARAGVADVIRVPPFDYAIFIAFVAALIQNVVAFVIGLLFGFVRVMSGADLWTTNALMTAVLLPTSFVVLAGVLQRTLPTKTRAAGRVAATAMVLSVVVFGMIVLALILFVIPD